MLIHVQKNHGQAFVEFLFLFLVLTTLSFTLLTGMNTGISDRWRSTITAISQPTSSSITLP